MQNNSASVNIDISCLGCSDMLRENWTARNLRPLIGQFTLQSVYEEAASSSTTESWTIVNWKQTMTSVKYKPRLQPDESAH